jgi:hypothetical protein
MIKGEIVIMFSYDELVNRQKKKKGRKKEGKKKKRKPWKHAILIRLPVIQPSLLVRIHYYNFTFDHEKSLKILI